MEGMWNRERHSKDAGGAGFHVGKRPHGRLSPKGWATRRDSDASAPLKAPVNDDKGFGWTGRGKRGGK